MIQPPNPNLVEVDGKTTYVLEQEELLSLMQMLWLVQQDSTARMPLLTQPELPYQDVDGEKQFVCILEKLCQHKGSQIARSALSVLVKCCYPGCASMLHFINLQVNVAEANHAAFVGDRERALRLSQKRPNELLDQHLLALTFTSFLSRAL